MSEEDAGNDQSVMESNRDGISVFREGDQVRHKGEGVTGVVANSEFGNLRIKWDDGHETRESHRTVERISGENNE